MSAPTTAASNARATLIFDSLVRPVATASPSTAGAVYRHFRPYRRPGLRAARTEPTGLGTRSTPRLEHARVRPWTTDLSCRSWRRAMPCGCARGSSPRPISPWSARPPPTHTSRRSAAFHRTSWTTPVLPSCGANGNARPTAVATRSSSSAARTIARSAPSDCGSRTSTTVGRGSGTGWSSTLAGTGSQPLRCAPSRRGDCQSSRSPACNCASSRGTPRRSGPPSGPGTGAKGSCASGRRSAASAGTCSCTRSSAATWTDVPAARTPRAWAVSADAVGPQPRGESVMSNDRPVPIEFQVEVLPSEETGVPADFANIWHTRTSLVLDFAVAKGPPRLVENPEDSVPHAVVSARVVARVRIPPEQAFEIARALTQQLDLWEQETGRRQQTTPDDPTAIP